MSLHGHVGGHSGDPSKSAEANFMAAKSKEPFVDKAPYAHTIGNAVSGDAGDVSRDSAGQTENPWGTKFSAEI